jgi:ribosomal protein S27E
MNIELDTKECIICMDNKETEWFTLECRHEYHKKCIHHWMRIRMTCPICVRVIAPSQGEEMQLMIHQHDSDELLSALYISRQRETSYILCSLLIIAIICIVIGGIVYVYG